MILFSGVQYSTALRKAFPSDLRRGATLIDLVIGLAILSLLFGGIFMVYFSILDATANVELRAAAAAAMNQEIEIIRNLPYDKVGTTGGIPAGVVPSQQMIAQGDRQFLLKTTIRNIDDPFDGTLGGSPGDTAPADYKLVSLEISCPGCAKFIPLNFTTTVAPKNLETASSTGSLFVNVFDASGQPVSDATVHITNPSVTPTIDLTDITNSAGLLQLVGVPSSTQSYHIEVSKSGYSSDQTYPMGGVGNPAPLLPDITVAVQTVSNASFAIDRTSRLNVISSDMFCAPIANKSFSLTGTKLIGAGVLKFSTSSQTDASGIYTFNNLEWDTYDAAITAGGYDLMGSLPLAPFAVNPSSSLDLRFVLAPASAANLLVTVTDGSGNGINDADVLITKGAFSAEKLTGHATVLNTDWSSGGYTDKSSNIDPDSAPGKITLLVNASGTYSSPAPEWLISPTIDLGGSSSTIFQVDWSGAQPPGAGAQSIQIQIAGNNDNATWNFVGPDGTAATYFTDTSFVPPPVINGNRFYRYKVFLSTQDETVTPELNSVTITFRGTCVPPYQALFSGISNGTYSVQVNAGGYQTATGSVAVSGSGQKIQIQMTP